MVVGVDKSPDGLVVSGADRKSTSCVDELVEWMEPMRCRPLDTFVDVDRRLLDPSSVRVRGREFE
jgi:hypothetical protein